MIQSLHHVSRLPWSIHCESTTASSRRQPLHDAQASSVPSLLSGPVVVLSDSPTTSFAMRWDPRMRLRLRFGSPGRPALPDARLAWPPCVHCRKERRIRRLTVSSSPSIRPLATSAKDFGRRPQWTNGWPTSPPPAVPPFRPTPSLGPLDCGPACNCGAFASPPSNRAGPLVGQSPVFAPGPSEPS